jgi:fluoride exporter
MPGGPVPFGGPCEPAPSGSLAGVARTLRERWDVLIAIGLGGSAGSLARWQVEQAWPARAGSLPWSTFAINVTGCALLGLLMVFLLERWPNARYLRPALGTGVLGGFTTFSTAMAESRALIVHGAAPVAAGYLVLSLVGGLLGVWAGTRVGRLTVGQGAGGRAS